MFFKNSKEIRLTEKNILKKFRLGQKNLKKLICLLLGVTLFSSSISTTSYASNTSASEENDSNISADSILNTSTNELSSIPSAEVVTKSILLKTSSGTYGEDGYFSNEFYTSLSLNDAWLTSYDKYEYNYGLAKFSVILSSAIYQGVSCLIDSNSFSNEKTAILDAFGFIDTKTESISVDYLDSEDTTTVIMGHKPVVSNGELHDVFVVVIRGTSGAAEWESNFDVGNDSGEYIEKTGDHPEWTDYDNHKGFDVAANRVSDLLTEYIKEFSTSDAIHDFLFTGHSRGAGISNVLGAKYEAAGENSCAYTFASPNTTTNPDKYPIKSVFNIINQNDFITTLPLEEWNFSRYGTDIIVDISTNEDVKKIAESSLGIEYTGQDPSFLTDCFTGFASSRDDLYIDESYECTYDTLQEKNTALANAIEAADYLEISNFITFKDSNSTNADGKYYFTETLCIGAFMTGLSSIMSDRSDYASMFKTFTHLNNVFPKDTKYSEGYSNFLNALTSNLLASFYPHMTTCYYAIVESSKPEDFDESLATNSVLYDENGNVISGLDSNLEDGTNIENESSLNSGSNSSDESTSDSGFKLNGDSTKGKPSWLIILASSIGILLAIAFIIIIVIKTKKR